VGNDWVHEGFEAFSRGCFENGGSNLYANANGVIETIHRMDVDQDGYVDLILTNGHGYIERAPTWIYKPSGTGHPASGTGKDWSRQQLPNDSGWMSRIIDVDGDGHADLVVVNGENGVTSELDSYIYWGGPGGVGGDRTELPTSGAYDVAMADLTGNGLLDVLFPSAWVDHHNPGQPLPIQVYEQVSPRNFVDASQRYGLTGIAATALVLADLTGSGRLDLVVANYRSEFEYETDSFVYRATGNGFDTDQPLRLPTHYAMQVQAADLNGDGYPEIIFAGGDEVWIYWNDDGRFDTDRCTRIAAVGFTTMFCIGAVRTEVADLDGDGRNELVIATAAGLEIRHSDDLQQVQTLLPIEYASWVHAADLDGDGRLDLIVSKYDNRVTYETESAVFWNGPDGFEADRLTRLPTAGAMGCTVGDLDGDGRPVIVFNNTMQGPSQYWDELPVYIYLGGPDADYGVHRRLELPVMYGSNGYVLADFDLDGYHDLIVTSGEGIRIFHGGPDGPRRDHYTDLNPEVEGYVSNVYVADFNRDGYLDLLLAAGTYDDKPETMARSSMILFGSPEGFSLERSQSIPTYGAGMHLADLNRNGYLDIVYCHKRGYMVIYHGGPDGFSPDRTGRFEFDGLQPGGVNAADLTGNGYLDLIIVFGSHYLREKETFIILFGSANGYSLDNSQRYDGGYTPGHICVADFNNDGHLDLLVGAYSTDLTRELPARLFCGDGRRLDLEHPVEVAMNSAHQVIPVDLNRNGYVDLVFICHRNDLGHQVDSMILWNGPEGISPARATPIPGLGPHAVITRDPGNAYTRQPHESYVSPPCEMGRRRPRCLDWDADVPETTDLKFQLRWAATRDGLEGAAWHGPEGGESFFETPGGAIPPPPPEARWLQYHAVFVSLYECASPQLRRVTVEFH
ncbi:MAG: VCBS repeat-containing protein, partial [Lentisphaeria bacterium]|nr:VCBS repeat-containing protein [Lentisphaeria bacterium]